MSALAPHRTATQDATRRESSLPVPPTDLQVQLSHPTSTCVLVQVSGDLDEHTAARLHEVLATRLSSTAEAVVLDLSQLSFIGVSGLELLNQAHQRAGTRGTHLRLVTGARCLTRALLAAEMTETFSCYATLDRALAGLSGRARHLAAVS